MRRIKPVWMVLALIVAAGVVVAIGDARRPKEVVPWRVDFTAASAEARRLHEPMLVYLTADWCGYCQQMARTTWADSAVAKALAGSVCVKVDVDQHADLAMKFDAVGIPKMIVLDEAGNVVKSVSGYMSADDFIAWLKSRASDGPADGAVRPN